MRLHVYALQRLMVSIKSALVTMQILVPFHASLEDGHKLPVRNMVPSLSGGEFLAEERHRALLLRQLCTQTHHRCITVHLEWLAEVRQLQHRCQSQLGFQLLRSTLLLLPPHKRPFNRQQIANRCHDSCKMQYKSVIIVCESKKLLHTLHIGRWLPLSDGCHLVVIHTKFA